MKLLFVSPELIRGLTYRGKFRELSKLAKSATIVVPRCPRPHEPEPGCSIVETRFLSFGHDRLVWFTRLDEIVRQERPDLIYIDDEPYCLLTWQCARVASKYGVPYVFVPWQNIYKDYPWPIRQLENYVIRHAAGVLAGNREAADILVKKNLTCPVAVIPQSGVDPELFGPSDDAAATKKELGLSDLFVVGYVGQWRARKGLDSLWTAFETLASRARLFMIGHGPWEPPRLDNVIRRSFLPTEDVVRFMRSMDVLVLPSLTEAAWKEQFGRVLVEAMACGVPVVGSDSGEIPTVIADAGRVFPEGDAAALGRILRELRDTPDERKRMQERGLRRVADLLGYPKVAERTMPLLRKWAGR